MARAGASHIMKCTNNNVIEPTLVTGIQNFQTRKNKLSDKIMS